jgi:hypothetical protein
MADGTAGEPVGSVHEETARLFAALEGAAAAWTRGDQGAAGAGGGGGADGDGGDAAADGPAAGHLPTTCGVCPLCLALDRLGRQRPEVLSHLGDAVQALGAALQALTTQPPGGGGAETPTRDRGRERPRSERIDVTD